MNVYVVELSRRLAALGVEVDLITRATSSDLPPAVELAPGVTVRHVTAGPFEGLAKEDLPAQLCAFTSGLMRLEAARPPGWYDLVHSHYWLSGQVAWLAAERWDVPLVHSMHTMAKVKNLTLADGDAPEPLARAIGEAQVVAAADRLVANTDEEADQLVELYDADPDQVVTVPPGVDLGLFAPGSRARARRRPRHPRRRATCCCSSAGSSRSRPPTSCCGRPPGCSSCGPELRDRLVVAVVGGPSGSGLSQPRALAGAGGRARRRRRRALRRAAGAGRAARLVPRGRRHRRPLLQRVLRAGGHRVAGLRDAGRRRLGRRAAHRGRRRRSGVLVAGHDPDDYAAVLAALADDPHRRAVLGRGAVEHAARFGWGATAAGVLDVYGDVARRARAAGGHRGQPVTVRRP